MKNSTIRIANVHDITAVAGLFDAYRRFYGRPSDLLLSESYIRQRMERNESIILVIEDQNNMIGFCQLYPTFCSLSALPIYILYDLFVHPEARRSGAARALMLAAEQQAVNRGVSRIDLSTAKTNLSAQALYESLGWKRDELFFTYSKLIS